MKKNAKKYGVMTIAAVLVVAMAFAGAASAATLDTYTGDVKLYVNNSGTWELQTKPLAEVKTIYNSTATGYQITSADDLVNIGYGFDIYILTQDIYFTDIRDEPVIWTFPGTLIGNGYTIYNLTIDYDLSYGGKIGLVGELGEFGTLNYVNLTCANISSSQNNVGGLVGYANSGNITGCTVTHSDIAGPLNVGGLVGNIYSNSFLKIQNSSVENCSISTGSDYVGGLVGNANTVTLNVQDCHVRNCMMSAGNGRAGGLVGYDYAENAKFECCNVTNSMISAGIEYVGGLVGYATRASYMDCNALNCTVMATNSSCKYVGGIVGGADSPSFTGCIAKDCAVAGNNADYVKELYGGGIPTGMTANGVIVDNPPKSPVLSIMKDSTSKYAREIGSDPVSFFKTSGASYYSYNGTDNKKYTILGVYGGENGFGYFSVSEPSTPYHIYITNKTNTYQLTSVLTKVYGDDGNGYANLTEVDTATGTYTLELNGFKASNMSSVPIIDASVPNLTIVLDGESKLTGSFAHQFEGLLTVNGNLTIAGDSSSKLLVENTRSSLDSRLTSIYVEDDLMIDGVKVTATTTTSCSRPAYSIYAVQDIFIGQNSVVEAATSTSSDAYSISAVHDIFIGQNSVVEATATSTNSKAYSLHAANDIEIESAKIVNATAESLGSESSAVAYGLYAWGTLAITDSQDVTATATAPYAYSIMTLGSYHEYYERTYDIVIANSKVTAKADGKYNAFALWCDDGNITITGDKTVIDANATCIGQAGSGAGAIFANNDITITSAERIKAIGTNSSFAYNRSLYGSLNINELADYKFSNASVDGDEPTLYSTFVNPNNWYASGTNIVSNYTAVLIEKKATTPSYTGSSSKQTGYTVILQDTVVPADAADTAATMYVVNFSMNGHGIQVMNQSVSFGNTAEEPSPVPTADGYTFTGWYADKGLVSKYAFSTPVTDDVELYAGWTAKPSQTSTTSKSPAPFVGILAGLGAAAVLLRLRK